MNKLDLINMKMGETTHDRDELCQVYEDELGVAAVQTRAGRELERVRLGEVHEIDTIYDRAASG